MKKIGPYKILKNISSNAYVLKFPNGFRISPTFNVVDLKTFCGGIIYQDEYIIDWKEDIP